MTLNGFPIPLEASVAELRDTVGSPGPRAWAAIAALAKKSEPEALTILVDLAHSSDWRFRRSAVEAIGMSPCGNMASDTVLRLLRDPIAFVVRSAIEACANLGLTDAHEKIIDLVKTAEDSTRLTALHSLEDSWQPTDFDLVFGLYLSDSSYRVRKQAAWTMRKNIHSDNWRRVVSAWSNDPIPRHRIWACELIESFGGRTDIPTLQPLLGEGNGHVRRAAERAVQRLEAVQKVVDGTTL